MSLSFAISSGCVVANDYLSSLDEVGGFIDGDYVRIVVSSLSTFSTDVFRLQFPTILLYP